MSKAARNREANAEKQRLKREREEFEAKKRKIRKITAIVTSAVLLVLILITIIGTAVYNARMNSGNYLRNEIAASSKNIDVNGAMMNYYFNDVYNTFVDYYGSYVQYYGLDTTRDLKQQEISEGESWFAYFMSGAKSNVSGILALNEAAAAAGVSLSDDEIKAIKTRTDRMDAALYGRGVKNNDIYEAKLLEALAYKYQFMKQNEFLPAQSEINANYNESPSQYQLVDCYEYQLSWSNSGMSREEAEAIAEKLANATGVNAFKQALKAQIATSYPTMTDEELNSDVEDHFIEGVLYTADNEFSEWAYNGAKVGDTKVIIDENNSRIRVYMLMKEPYRSESQTINVRHILFNKTSWGGAEKALAKAQEILGEFNNGTQTEEAFGVLALAYSDDVGSYYNGGLYENVAEGQMVETFNDWCFNPTRKSGDVDIIETDYGYHIMYFVGDGLEVWEDKVSDNIISEKFNDFNTEITTEYSVLFDDTILNKIPS
ncbi:MAG: hypothetical protein HFE63_04480 [Clostridiales bacterium]|nr:hypothetical protein [Clostridiales bacterium]